MVADDTVSEGSEAFDIAISNPLTTGSGTVTTAAPSVSTQIVDNDAGPGAVRFYVTGNTVTTEDPTDGDANQASFTVGFLGTLNVGETASVDVSDSLSQTDASDFSTDVASAITAAVSGAAGVTFDGTTLTFSGGPDNVSSLNFAVVVSDDLIYEGDETVHLQLSNARRSIPISADGLLRWQPGLAGDYDITITVDDGRGGQAVQSFTLPVVTTNDPPTITSTPVGPAYVGQIWQYQIAASDPNGDPITYSLTSPPAGMTVDAVTGLVSWSPSAAGTYSVTVVADDGQGGQAIQTFSLPVEAVLPSNDAPQITSTPGGPAWVDGLWNYQVTATDPNGDTLTYSLNSAPANMTIGAGGLVSWQPDSVGSYDIVVAVSDGNGGTATQSFTLTVLQLNSAPEITSTPRGPAYLTDQWIYQAEATDPDGDTLTWSLTTSPAGMIIDSVTGEIGWTPTATGNFDITVSVDDGRGGVASQSFPLPVEAVPPTNDAPVIQSVPPTSTRSNLLYEYQIVAYDPNGDALTYSLTSAPQGMVLTADGVLSWDPQVMGDYDVTVSVQDEHGAFAEQSWTLAVIEPVTLNDPPEITSAPASPAVRNRLYEYQVTAFDPNGDTLSYSLTSAPTGMTIDSVTGLVAWTPAGFDADNADVTIAVYDTRGGTATQQFTLPVIDNAPPIITSAPILSGTVGQAYNYPVAAYDPNGDAITFTLTDAPAGMSIDGASGEITWTPASIGVYTVEVTVTDSELAAVTQSFGLAVNDPVNNNAPVITSEPRQTIQAGDEFLYQLIAFDPDGDQLTYSLISSPVGMTVDTGGRILWTPAAADINDPITPYQYTVRVEDGRGGVAEQTRTLDVTEARINSGPNITSTPPAAAVAGYEYVYDVTADDPDHDVLVYTLSSAPAGMTIDEQTGLISWTPVIGQIGDHTVSVTVSDPYAASATQTYTLGVRSTNSAPLITSIPPAEAIYNQLYNYAIEAFDPDGDALTYSLLGYPSSMTIDSATGLISWTPLAPGDVVISLRVADDRGAYVDQTYTLRVTDPAASNLPPVITSQPDTYLSIAGQQYQYQVTAEDPNPTDVLTFSLAAAPAGMMIDSVSGLISWTPTSGQTGQNYAIVTVSDGTVSVGQQFGVYVRTNTAPNVQPVADASFVAGELYQLAVYATDPDNDRLTYSLDTAPAGMTITEYGLISWQTAVSDVASHPVTVTVSDSYGVSTSVSWNLTVTADTIAPQVAIIASAEPALLGSELSIIVRARDNVGVESVSLTLNGNPVVLNGSYAATIAVDSLTSLVFDATATDAAGNIGTASKTLAVIDPTDVNQPVVSIAEPIVDATLTEVTDITGSVSDPDGNLTSWTLVARSLETNQAFDIASGTSPVSNGVLGRLDTTSIANGWYSLELSATDTGGNSASTSRVVQVDAQLKMGNFNMTFVDLEVPVSGIPITVSRTYDTLNAGRQGDFGYGWTLDFSNTSVETTGTLGQFGAGNGSYNSFVDGTRVVITLPDGTTEGFTFVAEPYAQYGVAYYYTPRFLPDFGVTSTLEVASVQFDKLGEEYIDYYGDSYHPENYGNYTLTTRAGIELQIDPSTGDLISITDRSGNTLYYRNDGIFSSTGRAVTFERDYADRITAVIDPAGNRIEYAYDAAGDLVSVTDQVGATTQFTYLDGPGEPPHYLDQIIDAYGRPAARTIYDDAGRISSVIDAAGYTIDYTYDTTGRHQTITNQLGHVSHVYFDARGNITQEVDPLGGTITRTFDGDDNLLTETTVIGQVDSAENGESDDLTVTNFYNSEGDLVRSVDSRGNETRTTFNEHGQQTSTTDFLGNINRIDYGISGLPTGTVDVLGNRTSFGFDPDGDLRLVKDDNGNSLVTNTHNSFGDVISSTSVTGRTTYIDYDLNGNQVGTWYFEGSGADEVQVLTITHYDSLKRVTGTTRAVLPSGQFITSGLATAVVSSQHVITQTSTVYNAAGLVESTTDANGLVTENFYDIRGQLIQVRRETRDENGAVVWLVSRTAWDAAGRTIAATSEFVEGTTTQVSGTLTTYDETGRVILTQQVSDLDVIVTGSVNNQQAVVVSTGDAFSSSGTEYTPSGRVTATVDSYGLQTLTTYNTFGDVTEIHRESRDNDGNPVWFVTQTVYDEYGRNSVATDRFVLGTAAPIFGTQTIYDEFGRVVRSVRLEGVQVDVDSATGNATLVDSGSVVFANTTSYDGDGRTAVATDSYGFNTYTTYDSLGRVTETRRESVDETDVITELITRTVYDGLGRVDISTDSFLIGGMIYGSRTEYDALGRAVKSIRLQNVDISIDSTTGDATLVSPGTELWTTETIYNDDGSVRRTIGAEGQLTDYEYDSIGRQVATTGPEVVIDGVTVRLRSETDYDAQGRAVRQRTNIKQITNGTPDDLTDDTIDASAAQETTHEFDSRGNLIRTTYADNSFIEMTYDDRGRKLSETNQMGLTRTFSYDDQGRLAGVTLPDLDGNAATTNDIAVYQYGYDAFGNQSLLVDPNGRETRWSFDDYGREVSRTLPLGFGADGIQGTADDGVLPEGDFKEHKEYDSRGRLSLHTSFEGVVTQYIYDDDPLLTVTNPAGRLAEKRFYDDATAYANGSGTPSETWSYTYDAFGRERTVTQTAGAASLTVTNTYDDQGLLVSVSSPAGVIGYSYDNLGRRTQTAVYLAGQNPFIDTPQRTTSFTYDALGRLASVTEDRDASVTTDALLETEYAYDLLGNLDRTLLPNGILEDYEYDSLNRLDKLTHYKTDGTPADLADLSDNSKVAEFDYTVRADGKRTDLLETFWENSGGTAVTNTFAWQYDNLGRLVSEALDSTDDALDFTTIYSYDLTGNRKQVTRDTDRDGIIDETIDYTHDANDRLKTETVVGGRTTTYSYDRTQQTGKTVTQSDSSSVETVFTYDLQGRMHTATITTKDTLGVAIRIERATYDYDSKGIRISALQEIDTNADSIWDQRTQTEFLVDHNNHTGYQQVVRETHYDADTGLITKTVDYSFGHDEISQTTRQYDASGNVISEETLIFGHDGHSNVRVLTDLAAAVVQMFVYDAYGQMLAIYNGAGTPIGGGNGVFADASLAMTNLLYSGEQFDTRIGQQYLRARYYDSATGTFNRLDPFFGNNNAPQSFHKYLYTHGDPVNGVDPTGLQRTLGQSIASMSAGQVLAASLTFAFAATILLNPGSFDDFRLPHISWPSFSISWLAGTGLVLAAEMTEELAGEIADHAWDDPDHQEDLIEAGLETAEAVKEYIVEVVDDAINAEAVDTLVKDGLDRGRTAVRDLTTELVVIWGAAEGTIFVPDFPDVYWDGLK